MQNLHLLTGRKIAISVSDSPDLAVLGLGEEHLRDAMVEIARHLLASGAHLTYGGDLRALGFTELLFELVARHRPGDPDGSSEAPVTNFLAWPVHISLSMDELTNRIRAFRHIGKISLLTRDGTVLTSEERSRLTTKNPSKSEWAQGLTAMRQVMTYGCDARILLGGQTNDFQAMMPGIAEEALLAISAQKPVFLLGGFGGCSRDIAGLMHFMAQLDTPRRASWKGRRRFAGFRADALNNGLSHTDCQRLTRTVHVDEMVALILRGLRHLYPIAR
jgi:hypothetical protein